jgi:hypothetical protein
MKMTKALIIGEEEKRVSHSSSSLKIGTQLNRLFYSNRMEAVVTRRPLLLVTRG